MTPTPTNKGKALWGSEKLHQLWRRFFHWALLRNPIQRATFYFTINALKRSRQHKLKLAIYLALPLGYVLTQLIYLFIKKGLNVIEIPSTFMISIPLLLSLFIAAGLRLVVRQPLKIEASWLFRVSENKGGFIIFRESKKPSIGLRAFLFSLYVSVFMPLPGAGNRLFFIPSIVLACSYC